MNPRRTLLGAAAAAAAVVCLAGSLTAPTSAAPAASGGRPLTNLAHLDWLGAKVAPPAQDGHTTYGLADNPDVGVLWTYADHNADGSFHRVGGGTYDASANTYGQGAYNADDMARASVVYLRHWQQTGSASSEASARALLRGLTYLQTDSGPDAGNVVLWMQPDGTLHPSADPKDSPDPSDSDASYWLARTIWALGEGYADFKGKDPGFAGFLRQRLDLAVTALDREVLDRYNQYLDIDGTRTPAWLISDGADASSEAVLGLAAYVRAGGTTDARQALGRFSEGIADLSGGSATSWPYGALRPWALSLSDWHAWAAQMPSALAVASRVLGDKTLADAAARDSFTFDPWLLTSGGPDNGRLPTRADGSQIAYGVDSRVEGLLATGDATHSPAADDLAGLTAAWFFGANAAGQPMYDPSTGVTFDGISPDGTVNHNSGAESTIHGLLTMLALDAHPAVARLARTATVTDRVGTTTLQAEDAALGGGAQAVNPSSTWTGESQYGGTGYAALGDGGTATFTVPSGPAARVVPVVDLRPGSSAVTSFAAGGTGLGQVRSGAIGAQGDSPAPGALLPRTLGGVAPAGTTQLTATTHAQGTDQAMLDAVMLEPLVSRLVLSGNGHGAALLRSAADSDQRTDVTVPGSGSAVVDVYNGDGTLVSSSHRSGAAVPVDVVAGGFTLVHR